MHALLTVLVAPALAGDLPENSVSYELGDGLRFGLDDGRHAFRLGGFVQPAWDVSIVDGRDEHILAPRRTQLYIDGYLEDGRIVYEVLTDFSLAQALLNAWVGYRPLGDALTIAVGQRPNPANLREMLFNEGYLSLPERSLASTTFSETGREFGLFLDGEIGLGKARIRPSLSVTSGDGRNAFGVDSRDVDRGGFKWGGRLDVLPFGDFEEGNRAMVTDLAHESSPKVVLGGAFSLNDGASGPNGEGHDVFQLFDSEGNPQQPDYTKIHADLLIKWQGLSVLGEFVTTTAAGLQGTFTDPVGGNPLFAGQISEFLALGTAINGQVGYHARPGFGVDLRYTVLQDEFPEYGDSIVVDTNVASIGLTAFLRDHDLKIQLAGSRIDPTGAEPRLRAELLGHLRF